MLTPRGASYDLECLLRSVISLGHLGLTGVVCCFKCCIAKAKLNLDGMTFCLPCCFYGLDCVIYLYWMGNLFRGSEPRGISGGKKLALGWQASRVRACFPFLRHFGAGFTLRTGIFLSHLFRNNDGLGLLYRSWVEKKCFL
jgi:hypothetical protein